jgi:hypothetical protein
MDAGAATVEGGLMTGCSTSSFETTFGGMLRPCVWQGALLLVVLVKMSL